MRAHRAFLRVSSDVFNYYVNSSSRVIRQYSIIVFHISTTSDMRVPDVSNSCYGGDVFRGSPILRDSTPVSERGPDDRRVRDHAAYHTELSSECLRSVDVQSFVG